MERKEEYCQKIKYIGLFEYPKLSKYVNKKENVGEDVLLFKSYYFFSKQIMHLSYHRIVTKELIS